VGLEGFRGEVHLLRLPWEDLATKICLDTRGRRLFYLSHLGGLTGLFFGEGRRKLESIITSAFAGDLGLNHN
jgi:hypothetical protein